MQAKDPEIVKKIPAMGAYLGHQTHDFHFRKNCPWMDERLVIPVPLRKAVVNQIHCFNLGRTNIFEGRVVPLHPPEFGGGRGWLQRVHRSR